jgi:hypothetical protein
LAVVRTPEADQEIKAKRHDNAAAVGPHVLVETGLRVTLTDMPSK